MRLGKICVLLRLSLDTDLVSKQKPRNRTSSPNRLGGESCKYRRNPREAPTGTR